MSGTSRIHPPRLERFGPKTLTGLMRPHNASRDPAQISKDIAAQWEAFIALRTAAGPVPKITYGLVLPTADGDTHVQYVSSSEGPARDGFTTLEVPPLYCAVFQHTGPTSGLHDLILLIFGKVLPLAGLEPAPHRPGVPEFIERYDGSYDPATGRGTLDVLVPLKE